MGGKIFWFQNPCAKIITRNRFPVSVRYENIATVAPTIVAVIMGAGVYVGRVTSKWAKMRVQLLASGLCITNSYE